MKTGVFGKNKDGKQIMFYCLENKNGMEMTVINLGAAIVSLKVKDKDDNLRDVVLGYDSVEDYEKNTCYFGAVIGRNSNRIKGGTCTLDGCPYVLEQNDNNNNLHSGSNGFHNAVWEAACKENASNTITFSYLSKDGEQDFPGNMKVKVIYTLTDDNEVVIDYEAETDQTTVANMTNHAYFNLAGHNGGSIENHILSVNASYYTPVEDNELIPTGNIESVKGTPLDFTVPKTIGKDIREPFQQLEFAGGYDHNFIIDGESGKMKLAAHALSERSGIKMDVYTDCPGIQLYSGNFIQNHRGKDGVTYDFRHGFCLETQYFPNGINQEGFESPILNPGDKYSTQTKYKFSV